MEKIIELKHTYRGTTNHKDCKVGEMVTVAGHNTFLIHFCLTSLSSPLCVTQRNRVIAIGMVLARTNVVTS